MPGRDSVLGQNSLAQTLLLHQAQFTTSTALVRMSYMRE